MQKQLKRIRRIWQIGVSCGAQNCLQIHGKYLKVFREYAERICVYGEDAKRLLAYFPKTSAKRHKRVYIAVNNKTNVNIFRLCLFSLYGID
jgi:hypothetical protein